MSEEEIDDILSDAGVRVEPHSREDKWRYEACFNKLHMPNVTGEWRTKYDEALKEALDFVEFN